MFSGSILLVLPQQLLNMLVLLKYSDYICQKLNVSTHRPQAGAGRNPRTRAARAQARGELRGPHTATPMLTVTFFLLGIGGVVAGCLYHESRRHAAACEQEEIDCKD